MNSPYRRDQHQGNPGMAIDNIHPADIMAPDDIDEEADENTATVENRNQQGADAELDSKP